MWGAGPSGHGEPDLASRCCSQKRAALLEVLSRIPQRWLGVSGTGMSPASALSPGALLGTVCQLLLQGHPVPLGGRPQDRSLPGESRERTPGLSSPPALLAGLARGPLGRICAREEVAMR